MIIETFNKKSKSFFHLMFASFFSLMNPLLGTTSIELCTLNSTLNSLAAKIDEISFIGLIGESLIGKKCKDIFSQEQMKSITPNINGDDLVLVAYDRNQNLYQLKSLKQKGTTCGIHAFKNCLWMIEGLSKNFNNFIESYLKILDQTTFDKYYETSSCKLNKYASSPEQERDIRDGKISCIQESKCLPENSIKYLDQIFSFDYSPPENQLYVDTISKEWRKLYKRTQHMLEKIEPKEDTNTIARASTIFYPWITKKEFMPFYNLITKDNFCIGLEFASDNGHMGHATCLIAHKIKNKTEYLFLDSMNLPFNNGIYQYMPLIESIKNFIENPENFKNALIRRAYVYALRFRSKDQPFRVFKTCLNVFLEDQFKDLNLLKTKLYQIYRPHFCVQIKMYMQKDLENKQEYEEILHKMNCKFF